MLMSTFEAILLGIVQGITEFLPVSSSGHLQLAQWLFGFYNLEQYILFNLVCHLGTLLALFYGFRQEIISTLFVNRIRFFQLMVAILPLFPLLLIMKPIKAVFNQPQYLGYCFLITALLLYVGIRFGAPKPPAELQNRKWRDPFVIGTFQAFAILPGISRSGSTISAGRLMGWTLHEAIVFSFLLSIPTLIGGMILESRHLFDGTYSFAVVGLGQYLIGFATSFFVGCFGLSLLMKIASKNKFIYFVWYCLAIGIATIIYTH